MRDFLTRLLLAVAITLVAFALVSPANAQTADDARSPAATAQQPVEQQSPKRPDASTPSSGDTQTQDALAFTGQVTKEKGQIVLHDPVTKTSYQFDDQSKAKPYLGKQVKVTGKLEMNSNTIQVERIEPLS
jgi:hypothetical protein